MIRDLAGRTLQRIDRFILSKSTWHHIPGSNQLMYIDFQHYQGKSSIIPDGCTIHPDDQVGEIHLDNARVSSMSLNLKDTICLLREELNALARASVEDEKFQPVTAYYCRTVLYPFISKEGFSITIINKGSRRAFLTIWENWLKAVYSSGPLRYREPRECWISKEQLKNRIVQAKA